MSGLESTLMWDEGHVEEGRTRVSPTGDDSFYASVSATIRGGGVVSVRVDQVHEDGIYFYPKHARRLAMALLRAADEAEKREREGERYV